jgi:hypothetical protein
MVTPLAFAHTSDSSVTGLDTAECAVVPDSPLRFRALLQQVAEFLVENVDLVVGHAALFSLSM